MIREFTNKLHDAIEEGTITAESVAAMALMFMSEDDVKELCEANDLFQDEDEEEEDADLSHWDCIDQLYLNRGE
jgi:Asp-tRNA(Asn)/Glu-tRNA(Gln) amidotransferase B subunit